MRNLIRAWGKSLLILGLFFQIHTVHSDSITDNYNTGDTLTATTLNNIKSAVNDNDARVDTLEAADLINRITALEAALAAHEANLSNPHAVTKAQVGLANLEDIRVNYTATSAPTVTDDINSGYPVGSVWIDVLGDQAYVLVDSTPGFAIWKTLTTKYYAIGDTGPAGGIVFYITQGGAHGLEAAPADLTNGAPWGCFGTTISGTQVTIGEGAQNTAKILAGCSDAGIAALLANNYTINGYSDWFLPSRDELLRLYSQRALVGGFAATDYWSSTQATGTNSIAVNFNVGNSVSVSKSVTNPARAVRAF